MKTKKLLLLIIALIISACSSSYTPSEKMLAFKESMTAEQAEQILQQVIWDKGDNKGICGSRGFWYDENSDLDVNKDHISMLAHKRGKQIKKENPAYKGIVVFEKQFYIYQFEFKKITSIEIYNDPLLLSEFPYCNNSKIEEDYRVVDLYVDKVDNLKFILRHKDFDNVMAALSLLIADKPIIIH